MLSTAKLPSISVATRWAHPHQLGCRVWLLGAGGLPGSCNALVSDLARHWSDSLAFQQPYEQRFALGLQRYASNNQVLSAFFLNDTDLFDRRTERQ